MKILILGTGHIGSVIAKDLAESMPSARIVVADRDHNRAEEAAARIGKKNVASLELDVSNRDNLVNTLKGFDLAIGALPGEIGFQALKACIDAKVNMVDVSFMPENPLALSEKATKAAVTIVPDCGVAPGLSHMLLMRGVSKLDHVHDAKILVGGLPSKPIPPLGYTITWSVEGLIDEYMRKARIIKDGKITEVEPLATLEQIELPGVGKLEAFFSDGLRTLLHTVKGVENLAEKTLRYPGHIEKIRLLREMGFFDEKPVQIDDSSVSPRSVTVKLLEHKLKKPEVHDILAMIVQVDGMKNGRKIRYSFYLLDHYDERNMVTAMARTTAYTASCVAQLIAKKSITDKGIIPPEKLGADEVIFRKLMALLKKRSIRVKESKKALH
ncbi:MAG TPA: saccharopine dehydrogenase family protein [Candidatus Bathyarchaeia archaeon]|nr:saccharopine dehydrogenase family protein [Candidatus Bathyarchaeia archaeon]